MFLTPEQLRDLTGFKQKSKQIRWLKRRRIRVFIRSDGTPVVCTSEMGGLEYRKARAHAYAMKRHASKMKRTPAWADQQAIQSVYEECRRLTRSSGLEYQVDHIIPLQGRLVSGLHVENNLRIIPAVENRQKHNAFSP